jgi:hypothetical protein
MAVATDINLTSSRSCNSGCAAMSALRLRANGRRSSKKSLVDS